MTLNIKIGIFNGFFGDFWLRQTFQERIAPKSPEIDQNSLYMKLSALNVFFTSLYFTLLHSRNFSYGGIKLGQTDFRVNRPRSVRCV